jgi:hypothetical protein
MRGMMLSIEDSPVVAKGLPELAIDVELVLDPERAGLEERLETPRATPR